MAVPGQTDVPGALAEGLQIEVTEHGATTTIAFRGEWDLAKREATRDAFRGALARHPERVILDLRGLSFLDSTGVHGVIELAHSAACLHIGLVIVLGPPATQRPFEICRLTELLPFASPGAKLVA